MPPKRKRQAATPDRTLRSSTRRAVIETNTFTQPSHTISQDSSAPITTQQTSSAEQPINSNSNTSSVDILNQLLARVESLSQEVQSLRQRERSNNNNDSSRVDRHNIGVSELLGQLNIDNSRDNNTNNHIANSGGDIGISSNISSNVNTSNNINTISAEDIEFINSINKKPVVSIHDTPIQDYSEWDRRAAITEKVRIMWTTGWEQGFVNLQLQPNIPYHSKAIWKAIALSSYIELEHFLSDTMEDRSEETRAIISEEGTVQIEKKSNWKITKGLQWMDAFTNYTRAVTTIYFFRSGEMQEYQQRMLSKIETYGMPAAYQFDKALCRQLEQNRNQTLLSPQPELEARYLHSGRLLQLPSRQQSQQQTNICFAFNNKPGCKRSICKYLHQCERCRSTKHGAYRCQSTYNTQDISYQGHKTSDETISTKPNNKQ